MEVGPAAEDPAVANVEARPLLTSDARSAEAREPAQDPAAANVDSQPLLTRDAPTQQSAQASGSPVRPPAQERSALQRNRVSASKHPQTPVCLMMILAIFYGPPPTFDVVASLLFDIGVFWVSLLLVMSCAALVWCLVTMVVDAEGRRSHAVTAVFLFVGILFLCARCPYHLRAFFSQFVPWFTAPIQIYHNWKAPLVQYNCSAGDEVFFANGSRTMINSMTSNGSIALLRGLTLNGTLALQIIEPGLVYRDGARCGQMVSQIFLHWRPLVWGLVSWRIVATLACMWPSMMADTLPDNFSRCAVWCFFLCSVPFAMLSTVMEGFQWTHALMRVVGFYLIDVGTRISSYFHSTAVDGKPPEAIKATDLLAVVLLLWWLSLPWRPDSVRSFAPFATTDLVESAMQKGDFHAKMKRSETASGLLRSASTKLLGRTDADAKDLEEKRTSLQKDCSAEAEKKLPAGRMIHSYRLANIRREFLLEDSMDKLQKANTFELLAHEFRVTFQGEHGIDAGGLTRDWFDSLAVALAKGAEEEAGSSLFVATTDETLMPRPAGLGKGDGNGDASEEAGLVSASSALPNEVKERFAKLITAGRFIAVAVLRNYALPLSFGTVLLKHMCDEEIDYKDVRRLDPDFYRVRVEMIMKENGVEEMNSIIDDPLTFISAPTEFVKEQKPLKEGGEHIRVDEKNKKEYAMLLCEAHLCDAFRRELSMFLTGFHDVLPLELLRKSNVDHQDLALLISGVPTLDVVEWRAHSASEGTEPDSELVDWFWEVVMELSDEQKARLLQFATGSSRVPAGGFKDFHPRFKLTVTPESGEHLPHSHTCFNQLMLPRYTDREQLKAKVLGAIAVGDMAGFGFA